MPGSLGALTLIKSVAGLFWHGDSLRNGKGYGVSDLSTARAMHCADMAALLRRVMVRPGRPVAVLSARADLLAVMWQAALQAGLPFFPLDPHLPAAHLSALLDCIDVGLVVADSPVVGYPWLDIRTLPAADPVSALPPNGADEMAPALLLATSGSSGMPKVVMHGWAGLRASAMAAAQRFPLLPRDRWLICLPLFHMGGMAALIRCALAGAQPVLQSGFEAERVMAALTDQAITHLSLVPTMLEALLALGAPPPSLRLVLIGGSALRVELAHRAMAAGWPIHPSYGLTETASQIATLADPSCPWPAGLVGQPLAGIRIACDTDGRLRIAGPMLMLGYGNPSLGPGDGLADGWFITADRARMDENGDLYIEGRVDDVIISGGKNVSPLQVEDLLAACNGVDDVMVCGLADDKWGQVIAALYSGSMDRADLQVWCRAHIPSGMRPRVLKRVDALPRLSNGKPDRRQGAKWLSADRDCVGSMA